jgi:hypothetical protein
MIEPCIRTDYATTLKNAIRRADTQLLGHLRSPGPHVRGCVAVDALLGRS